MVQLEESTTEMALLINRSSEPLLIGIRYLWFSGAINVQRIHSLGTDPFQTTLFSKHLVAMLGTVLLQCCKKRHVVATPWGAITRRWEHGLPNSVAGGRGRPPEELWALSLDPSKARLTVDAVASVSNVNFKHSLSRL